MEKTTVVSDLSGGADAAPFNFAVEADRYVVDLTAEELDVVREFLAPYITVARKDPRRRVQRRGGDQSEIREWARERGYNVAARGRISQAIVDEWEREHDDEDDDDEDDDEDEDDVRPSLNSSARASAPVSAGV